MPAAADPNLASPLVTAIHSARVPQSVCTGRYHEDVTSSRDTGVMDRATTVEAARPQADVDWQRVGLWGPPGPAEGNGRDRRPWGPRYVAYGIGWLIAANVALAVPVLWQMSSHQMSPEMAGTQAWILAAGLAVLWIVFAGVPWWASHRHGAGSLAVDFGFRMPSRHDWLAGAGLAAVMRLLEAGLDWAAQALGLQVGDNSSWLTGGWPVWISAGFALSAAVGAPVLEELFFRGLILRSVLRTELPLRVRAWGAVIVSAAIFGVLHTNAFNAGGAYVAASTALAGAVLAVVAIRRGNLGMSIATHVAFNTTGVALAWLVAR